MVGVAQGQMLLEFDCLIRRENTTTEFDIQWAESPPGDDFYLYNLRKINCRVLGLVYDLSSEIPSRI